MPTDNKGYLGTKEEFKKQLLKDAAVAMGWEYPPKEEPERPKPHLKVVK